MGRMPQVEVIERERFVLQKWREIWPTVKPGQNFTVKQMNELVKARYGGQVMRSDRVYRLRERAIQELRDNKVKVIDPPHRTWSPPQTFVKALMAELREEDERRAKLTSAGLAAVAAITAASTTKDGLAAALEAKAKLRRDAREWAKTKAELLAAAKKRDEVEVGARARLQAKEEAKLNAAIKTLPGVIADLEYLTPGMAVKHIVSTIQQHGVSVRK